MISYCSVTSVSITPPSPLNPAFRGFDHNCTAQLLANLLRRDRCLSGVERTQRQNEAEGYPALSRHDPRTLHICGNGVREAGEECDCGLPDRCRSWLCEPRSCTRLVPLWKLASPFINH